LSFYGYIKVTKLQRVLPAIYEWAESIRKNELNHAIKELSNTTTGNNYGSNEQKHCLKDPLSSSAFCKKEWNSNLLREVFQDVFRDKED